MYSSNPSLLSKIILCYSERCNLASHSIIICLSRPPCTFSKFEFLYLAAKFMDFYKLSFMNSSYPSCPIDALTLTSVLLMLLFCFVFVFIHLVAEHYFNLNLCFLCVLLKKRKKVEQGFVLVLFFSFVVVFFLVTFLLQWGKSSKSVTFSVTNDSLIT